MRGREEEEDDPSTREKIERFHKPNARRLDDALREGAQFWAKLEAAPHGEDDFIAKEAPRMRALFARESLVAMDRERFVEAMSLVNAFRMHARQQKNAFFGLPTDHHESLLARARRLAEWLWGRQSAGDRSVRDVLEYLIWSDAGDMEVRLWSCIRDPQWRIDHLGRSTLGEIVGWARPDRYPPRNNRANKALRALGHVITLFGD